tara:strand:- start:9082 stop:9549 length:468 start_codon:yes stop_codon:yes gene_type:complete
MANQDPQPEIYTTRHTFTGATAVGTSNTVTVYTNQANNEEVRLYALAVRILDAAGSNVTTETDFAVSIQVGPNNVPSNQFDVGWLAANIANGGSVMAFSTPVLCLFQQPLGVVVQVKTATTATRTVVVDLIGELAIQKVLSGNVAMHPYNDGNPV